MKILRLTAENIKKLKAVEIVPDGSVVQITGANGSGKTSVLDSIYWALAGTSGITSQPVREGEYRAQIRLDLGEVVVTRKFTEAGTTLYVESADGARFASPQRMLDELLGALTFDPLQFSRMAPRAQLEEIRKLVTLEVDIDRLDMLNEMDFANRTDVNRTVKALTEHVHTLHANLDPSLPAEPIDIDALIAELEGAGRFNAAIERTNDKLIQRRKEIERLRICGADKRAQAATLVREAELAEQGAVDEEQALMSAEKLPEPKDTTALRNSIAEARATNEKLKVRDEYDVADASLRAARGSAEKLTTAMENRKRQKHKAIAAAKMPIEGLSFGEGLVLYNGLPFDQASSAEQLRVSVAIAMAANPKLRVLRISDGSLLDESNLALIAQMAELADYQVWIEQVDTSGTVGIVMSEGEVVRVNEAAVA
jgi:energy-coupling factor transporter ATP-binding protein EcfA2